LKNLQLRNPFENMDVGNFGELLAHNNAVTYNYAYRQCVSAWIYVATLIKQLD
jgi:hypothetical protein